MRSVQYGNMFATIMSSHVKVIMQAMNLTDIAYEWNETLGRC